MAEQSAESPGTIERYEALLREHLLFCDALRLRERRPKSAATWVRALETQVNWRARS